MEQFQRYELKEALASLESAIADDPEFYPAHYGLSRLFRELGRDPKAQDEARQALALFDRLELDDERERALLEAYALETAGNWNLATYLYEALLTRFPTDERDGVRRSIGSKVPGAAAQAMAQILARCVIATVPKLRSCRSR